MPVNPVSHDSTDDQNRVVLTKRDDNQDGTWDRAEAYVYDAGGDKIRIDFYDDWEDGKGTADQQADKSLHVMQDYDSDGADDDSKTETFDGDGEPVQVEYDYDTDGTIDRIETWTYGDGDATRLSRLDDGMGAGAGGATAGDGSFDRMVEETLVDGIVVQTRIDTDNDGTWDETVDGFPNYSFDKDGHVVGGLYDDNGDRTPDRREVYTRDAAGAVTKREVELDDGIGAGAAHDGTWDRKREEVYENGRLTRVRHDDDNDGIWDQIFLYGYEGGGPRPDSVKYGHDANDDSAVDETTEFSIIYGGDGDDTIRGSAGDDWIIGGKGDDVITGAGGDNWLVYRDGDGTDVVTDLELPFRLWFIGGVSGFAPGSRSEGTFDGVGGEKVSGAVLQYGERGDQVRFPGVVKEDIEDDGVYRFGDTAVIPVDSARVETKDESGRVVDVLLFDAWDGVADLKTLSANRVHRYSYDGAERVWKTFSMNDDAGFDDVFETRITVVRDSDGAVTSRLIEYDDGKGEGAGAADDGTFDRRRQDEFDEEGQITRILHDSDNDGAWNYIDTYRHEAGAIDPKPRRALRTDTKNDDNDANDKALQDREVRLVFGTEVDDHGGSLKDLSGSSFHDDWFLPGPGDDTSTGGVGVGTDRQGKDVYTVRYGDGVSVIRGFGPEGTAVHDAIWVLEEDFDTADVSVIKNLTLTPATDPAGHPEIPARVFPGAGEEDVKVTVLAYGGESGDRLVLVGWDSADAAYFQERFVAPTAIGYDPQAYVHGSRNAVRSWDDAGRLTEERFYDVWDGVEDREGLAPDRVTTYTRSYHSDGTTVASLLVETDGIVGAVDGTPDYRMLESYDASGVLTVTKHDDDGDGGWDRVETAAASSSKTSVATSVKNDELGRVAEVRFFDDWDGSTDVAKLSHTRIHRYAYEDKEDVWKTVSIDGDADGVFETRVTATRDAAGAISSRLFEYDDGSNGGVAGDGAFDRKRQDEFNEDGQIVKILHDSDNDGAWNYIDVYTHEAKEGPEPAVRRAQRTDTMDDGDDANDKTGGVARLVFGTGGDDHGNAEKELSGSSHDPNIDWFLPGPGDDTLINGRDTGGDHEGKDVHIFRYGDGVNVVHGFGPDGSAVHDTIWIFEGEFSTSDVRVIKAITVSSNINLADHPEIPERLVPRSWEEDIKVTVLAYGEGAEDRIVLVGWDSSDTNYFRERFVAPEIGHDPHSHVYGSRYARQTRDDNSGEISVIRHYESWDGIGDVGLADREAKYIRSYHNDGTTVATLLVETDGIGGAVDGTPEHRLEESYDGLGVLFRVRRDEEGDGRWDFVETPVEGSPDVFDVVRNWYDEQGQLWIEESGRKESGAYSYDGGTVHSYDGATDTRTGLRRWTEQWDRAKFLADPASLGTPSRVEHYGQELNGDLSSDDTKVTLNLTPQTRRIWHDYGSDGTYDKVIGEFFTGPDGAIAATRRSSTFIGDPLDVESAKFEWDMEEEHVYGDGDGSDDADRKVRTDFYEGTAADRRLAAQHDFFKEYDGDGNADDSKFETFDADGSPSRTEYDYDSDGVIDRIETWTRSSAGDEKLSEIDDGKGTGAGGTVAGDGNFDRRTLETFLDGAVIRTLIDEDNDGTWDSTSESEAAGSRFTYDDGNPEQLVLAEFASDADIADGEPYTYNDRAEAYTWSGGVKIRIDFYDTWDDAYDTADLATLDINRSMHLMQEYDGDGASDDSKTETLDSAGRAVRVEYDYDSDGDVDYIETFTWNSDPNDNRWLSESKDIDKDGTADTTTTVTYHGASDTVATREVSHDDGSGSGTANDGTDDRRTFETFNDKGALESTKRDDDDDGTYDRADTYTYHGNGEIETKLTEEDIGRVAGGVAADDGTFDRRRLYTYDDKGVLETVKRDDDNDGTNESVATYVFRDDGSRQTVNWEIDNGGGIRGKGEPDDGTIDSIGLHKYNEDDRVTYAEIDTDNNGVWNQRSYYTYHENGTIMEIREEVETGMDGIPTRWRLSAYDATGAPTGVKYDDDGDNTWDRGNTILYTRDERGRDIQIKYDDNLNGTFDRVERYSYENDDEHWKTYWRNGDARRNDVFEFKLSATRDADGRINELDASESRLAVNLSDVLMGNTGALVVTGSSKNDDLRNVSPADGGSRDAGTLGVGQTFNLGAGNDMFFIRSTSRDEDSFDAMGEQLTSAPRVTVNGGDGSDVISTAIDVRGAITVNGGMHNDTLKIGNGTSEEAAAEVGHFIRFDGGAGSDTLLIKADVGSELLSVRTEFQPEIAIANVENIRLDLTDFDAKDPDQDGTEDNRHGTEAAGLNMRLFVDDGFNGAVKMTNVNETPTLADKLEITFALAGDVDGGSVDVSNIDVSGIDSLPWRPRINVEGGPGDDTLTGGAGRTVFWFRTERDSAGGDDTIRGYSASDNDVIEIAGAGVKDGSTTVRRDGSDTKITYTLVGEDNAETEHVITVVGVSGGVVVMSETSGGLVAIAYS